MFRILYLVWFIVPLSLFCFGLSASFRQARNTLKKGYASLYFKQSVYSLIGFVVAVFVDQTIFASIAKPILVLVSDDPDTATNVLSWAIYPAVLFIGALIVTTLKPKEKEESLVKRTY